MPNLPDMPNMPNVMENELFNLQKKIMDLESKLNYGDPPEQERMHQPAGHGGSGASEEVSMPRPL